MAGLIDRGRIAPAAARGLRNPRAPRPPRPTLATTATPGGRRPPARTREATRARRQGRHGSPREWRAWWALRARGDGCAERPRAATHPGGGSGAPRRTTANQGRPGATKGHHGDHNRPRPPRRPPPTRAYTHPSRGEGDARGRASLLAGHLECLFSASGRSSYSRPYFSRMDRATNSASSTNPPSSGFSMKQMIVLVVLGFWKTYVCPPVVRVFRLTWFP